MSKIGIISQARMRSTRLPGKVLKEINGIPLLQYHIERLNKSSFPLLVATTTNKSDDPIIEFCKKSNYDYFRGSENNVLERYFKAAKERNFDIIVRVTSDCPLIDGIVVKEAIHKFLSKNNNMLYLSNGLSNSFPRGFDFEIFSFDLLKLAYSRAISKSEKEHVTPYLYSGNDSSIKVSSFPYKVNRKNYRLTVDTKPDFELINKLVCEFNAGNKSIDEIVKILDNNPYLLNINSHIKQKTLND